MTKARIHFLEVQPHYLLVGNPNGFQTKEEFWKFAAQECGFVGITVAARPDLVNIRQLIEDPAYRDKWQSEFVKAGLTDGCSRLEAHVTMQNVCLDPSRRLKFGHFVRPDFRSVDHRQIEETAAAQVRDVIDAAAALGHRYIVGFSGGRGYAKAQAKWAAYPKFWKLWVFALLAAKWNSILEYAADRGVKLAFEIGHPENDILTGENFVLFWSMLTPKARKGVAVNLDGSHYANVGVNPVPHGQAIVAGTTDEQNPHGAHFVDHRKWGVAFDKFNGTASPYGGFDDWGTASSTFCTYGTISPAVVQQHHAFLQQRYAAQDEPDMPSVYEGECVFLRDPRVGMRVGFNNIKALHEGGQLTTLCNIAPASHIQTETPTLSGAPYLTGLGGKVEINNGNWPNFDAFADIPVKPWELLELQPDEVAACQSILEGIDAVQAMQAI